MTMIQQRRRRRSGLGRRQQQRRQLLPRPSPSDEKILTTSIIGRRAGEGSDRGLRLRSLRLGLLVLPLLLLLSAPDSIVGTSSAAASASSSVVAEAYAPPPPPRKSASARRTTTTRTGTTALPLPRLSPLFVSDPTRTTSATTGTARARIVSSLRGRRRRPPSRLFVSSEETENEPVKGVENYLEDHPDRHNTPLGKIVSIYKSYLKRLWAETDPSKRRFDRSEEIKDAVRNLERLMKSEGGVLEI